MAFMCSICGEESTRICARCTKDACTNHLCEKCQRCSDCCECEVALSGAPREISASEARSAFHAAANHEPQPVPDVEPEPAPDVEPEPHPTEPHSTEQLSTEPRP